MKHIIIGNSAAAVGAVTGIRKVDKTTPIVIVSKEKHLAYSRPSISSLLAGKITMEKMPYRKADFYEKNNVELMLETEVLSIDTHNKKLLLKDKKPLSYGNLLIATGGKPFVPPIAGLDKEDTLTFTTLDDSLKLKEISGEVKEIVIIGGGLIGLKAAEGLVKAGVSATVVELAPRVLSTAFDSITSNIIQEAFVKKGVAVITGDTVAEVKKKDGKVTGVVLKSGKKLKCSAVVVAIGVVPNSDVAKGGDIKINRGIIVDDNMSASAKGVYAAGDVAEGYDMVLGAKRVLPIWTNAFIQGKVAGMNMAGEKISYAKLMPINSITFCDIPIISMGLTEPLDEKGYKVLEKNDLKNNIHKRLIIKDNAIVGGCFVTNIDRAGLYTSLIKDKIDVSDYFGVLLDDNFSFAFLKRELRDNRMKTVNRSLLELIAKE